MKKILLLFFILISLTSSVSAQKQPAKKNTQKRHLPPPIKPPSSATNNIPPPLSPGNSGIGAPMISEPPSKKKFDSEKICITCDTLVLEAGKPHIIIYDVKWLADIEGQTYLKQPTESDLSTSYYEMKGDVKREWEELKRNFPENKFSYHHVYRSTFIKTQNRASENVSLLNRQDRHEGFVYWSGDAKDKIVATNQMVRLTEKVAKERGENKNSSYYPEFKKDSIAVQKLQKTSNPDKNIQPNMNSLLQEVVMHEFLLPFAFLNLKNVSEITVASATEPEKTFVYKFNKNGQLLEINSKYENGVIAYKDNLPLSVSKSGEVREQFYYQGAIVAIKDPQRIIAKKLIGDVFFDELLFEIQPRNYEAVNLKSHLKREIITVNGETCEQTTTISDGRMRTECYSNTAWKLPLKITHVYNGESTLETYSNVETGTLLIETANASKSRKLEYKMKDGVVSQIIHTEKRGDVMKGTPYILNVKTAYFK